MTFRASTPRFLFVVLLAAQNGQTQSAPIPITLTPTTSPSAGEPGVTAISVIGSNFPAGTITPAGVTVRLTPAAGGPAVTTAASAVTTVIGTTRRVSFTIPASIKVAASTSYTVSLSGATTTGTAFVSSNTASLTVNPGASVSNINPTSGQQGQTLSVAVTGLFSNFVQGSTQASFGAGIIVNSTTVTSSTAATVNMSITASATPGTRTVTMTTGIEVASLANGFTVTAAGLTITDFNPKSGPIGTLVTLTGSNFGTAPQIAM